MKAMRLSYIVGAAGAACLVLSLVIASAFPAKEGDTVINQSPEQVVAFTLNQQLSAQGSAIHVSSVYDCAAKTCQATIVAGDREACVVVPYTINWIRSVVVFQNLEVVQCRGFSA